MGEQESVDVDLANYGSTKKLLDNQAESSEHPDDENEETGE